MLVEMISSKLFGLLNNKWVWAIAIILGLLGCIGYLNWRVEGLKEKNEVLEAKLEDMKDYAEALREQTSDCFEEFERFKVDNKKRKAILKKAERIPLNEIPETVDKNSSTQLIDLYNGSLSTTKDKTVSKAK